MATPVRKRKGPYFLTSGPRGERARARELGVWNPLRHGDFSRERISRVEVLAEDVRTGRTTLVDALRMMHVEKVMEIPPAGVKKLQPTHPVMREILDKWRRHVDPQSLRRDLPWLQESLKKAAANTDEKRRVEVQLNDFMRRASNLEATDELLREIRLRARR